MPATAVFSTVGCWGALLTAGASVGCLFLKLERRPLRRVVPPEGAGAAVGAGAYVVCLVRWWGNGMGWGDGANKKT